MLRVLSETELFDEIAVGYNPSVALLHPLNKKEAYEAVFASQDFIYNFAKKVKPLLLDLISEPPKFLVDIIPYENRSPKYDMKKTFLLVGDNIKVGSFPIRIDENVLFAPKDWLRKVTGRDFAEVNVRLAYEEVYRRSNAPSLKECIDELREL